MTSSGSDYLYKRKKEGLRVAKKLLETEGKLLETEGKLPSLFRDLIEHLHDKKSWLENTISSIESYDSNTDSERLLRKFRKELHDVERKISAKRELQKKLIPNARLDEFDPKSLTDDLLEAYVCLTHNYEETGHFNYVLEMFAVLVRKGVSPPAWVLKDIADRVANYLNEPERSPETLLKQLGLVGEASGAINPIDHQAARRERSMMMIEMAALVRDFNLSRNRAAQAITIKYELTQSLSTIKRWFKEYFGDKLERVIDAKNPIVMNNVERTQFVSSFPPSARRLFKKSSA